MNRRKSKELVVGGRNKTTNALDIAYYPEIKILGVNFTSTVEQSMNKSWKNITGKFRARARDAYGRDLCLSQRILYVNTYLLAKIWHTAQVFQVPTACKRQLITVVAWYIWQGATFRYCEVSGPLYQQKWLQSTREGSATATLFQCWDLSRPRANPPYIRRTPKKLKYLCRYALDMAYIAPPG